MRVTVAYSDIADDDAFDSVRNVVTEPGWFTIAMDDGVETVHIPDRRIQYVSTEVSK